MSLSEFDLIRRYFSRRGAVHPETKLGVGDDAALVEVPSGMELVVAVDTLIEGVHFPHGTDPVAIGHKALAVNLSDMAAMGARPMWATLALSLPDAEPTRLAGIAEGFFALAEQAGVELIGGDTVRGPLSLSVQILGLVERGRALRRRGSQPGDLVCVSGTLGDAGAGLRIALGESSPGRGADFLRNRLDLPTPRLELGAVLAEAAHAAIDISDGLLADLGHLLEDSELGASLDISALPLSSELVAAFGEGLARELALHAGDDYELCFTLAPEYREALSEWATRAGCPLTVVGRIEDKPGIRLVDAEGQMVDAGAASAGYDHFAKGEARG